jgi:hypothetical protein
VTGLPNASADACPDSAKRLSGAHDDYLLSFFMTAKAVRLSGAAPVA